MLATTIDTGNIEATLDTRLGTANFMSTGPSGLKRKKKAFPAAPSTNIIGVFPTRHR